MILPAFLDDVEDGDIYGDIDAFISELEKGHLEREWEILRGKAERMIQNYP